MQKQISEELLTLFESLFRAQLNTIRQLRKAAGLPVEKEEEEKRMSNMDIVYDILQREGRPLHIDHILSLAQQRFPQKLDKESVVSALAKRVKRQDQFIKTGPNTFALLAPRSEGGKKR
jgi:hypothetical protein